MVITQVLLKWQMAREAKRNAYFTVPVAKQRKFLASMPEPKDDIERGYCQYRCQAKLQGRFMNSLISFASFPVTLLMLLKYSRASAPEKEQPCENRAVLFRDGKPANIVPVSLQEEFAQVITDPVEGGVLRKEDRKFIGQLFRRHPFSWLFLLKCTIKIARYRYAMEKYAPRALIVCNEYSFTSSVLTEFCGRNQLELINVMHGDKFFDIRDSFFHFHRCYVWDAHYIRLFESMRAASGQFRVEIPESVRFHVEQLPEKCYDYTYYLGGENREALLRLHNMLARMQENGVSVNVRPHPRYTDMEALKQIYTDIHVEDGQDTIEMSVLKSRAVISQFSTVLLQAYYNGIPVVVDDVTNPEQYEKLRELEYSMVDKPHQTLSALTKEVRNG